MKPKTLKDFKEEHIKLPKGIKKYKTKGKIPLWSFDELKERDLWFRNFGARSIKRDLKQEAIKHIKYLQEFKIYDCDKKFCKNNHEKDEECIVAKWGAINQIVWIKYFFNIKENDLDGN